MNYAEFLAQLDERYYAYYDKGLKKQANANIKALMQTFDTLPQETRDHICQQFCQNYFDGKQGTYRNRHNARGNGSIAYELGLRLKAYLQRQSEQNQMPHLRWFYQFTHDQERLQRAYVHPERDAKTIELMFNCLINNLYWWQHHFPDGCLTTQDIATEHIARCANFAQQHATELPANLLDEFRYYQKLYPLYWQWATAYRDQIPFEDFCRQNGLSFVEEKVYYY